MSILERDIRKAPPCPGQPKADNILRSCGLEVDLDTREVRAHGGAVHLSPLEIRFLLELVSNPNRAISYEELLVAVWGCRHREDLEYLRNMVCRIRKKMARVCSSSLEVRNVNNFGYGIFN